MKQYQVTSKRQVTIPRNLAERVGIRPGDSVFFQETLEGIVLKKVNRSEREDIETPRKAIEEFLMLDVPLIRKQLKRSRRAINENLSGHLASQ